MTSSELKNKILEKGWYFRFLSPNPQNKSDFGWKRISELDSYGGFEGYLKKIAETQKLKQLNIDTKAKNGTGFMKKGIFLVDIEPVENIGSVENVAPIKPISSIPVSEHIESHKVKEIEKIDNNPTSHKMQKEDLTTHIENASMKTELRFLQAERDTLKESNKKLDQKNEELFNEVSRLSRELSTSKAGYDLDFRKKELELNENNKPKGLGAIVDEIKNLDPKTIALGISVFQPNNPAVMKMLSEGEDSGGGSLNGPKHENSETQSYIEHTIYPMLVNASSGEIGMIGSLIEYFTHNDTGRSHLAAAYKKFISPGFNNKTETPGKPQEESEEDDD